jgi:uncharacterized membrane protein
MEVAESILPGSLKRTLDAFEKQQAHDHKMDGAIIELHQKQQDQDSSDSWKSFSVVIIFGAILAAMLFQGMIKEAGVFGGFFLSLGVLARVVRKKKD